MFRFVKFFIDALYTAVYCSLGLGLMALRPIMRAAMWANAAHGSQKRKYNGGSYIHHPLAVARLVATTEGVSLSQLIAAILHDVVEDTPKTIEDVRRAFGRHVAALVDDLTDVSKPSDGNRNTRKALDLAHIAIASAEAKTVRLADIADNAPSIRTGDPKFARRAWVPEKMAELQVLFEGDSALWSLAYGRLTRLKF